MSCSNPGCWRNPNHPGVGQSPDHPDDITDIVNFWLVAFGILGVVVILIGVFA